MDQARHEFCDARRIEELTKQPGGWPPTLSAMREQIRATTIDTDRSAAETWLAWVSEYRSRIDPLRHSLRMPTGRKPSTCRAQVIRFGAWLGVGRSHRRAGVRL
jgi:hypothetical protein